MTNSDLPALPQRPKDSHKGTFGTVGVVGGCAAGETLMIGAPALVATAALRSGVGLAKIAAPLPILAHAIGLAPGATGIGLPVDDDGHIVPHETAATIDTVVGVCDCLAIGPGMGRGEGVRAAALRAIQQEDVPAVVDADAINAMAEMPQITRDLRGSVVLTPHPGEFKRLARGMGMSNDLGIDRSREDAALQLAQRLGCIVVLKGAGTVVTDGQRVWTNTSGHPCLATAGTGDVLTGLIAGVIAQFVRPTMPGIPPAIAATMPRPAHKPLEVYDAVRIGVYAHGLGAERWADMHGATGGMLAMELTAEIPGVIESLRAGS